jgi:hypothetical protein
MNRVQAGVRLGHDSSGVMRRPPDEMEDEENHKQSQQNVNRPNSYMEGNKADQPCDQEYYCEYQPHTKVLSRVPVWALNLIGWLTGCNSLLRKNRRVCARGNSAGRGLLGRNEDWYG